MSFSSTIDKNAWHNFLENAITGTIDIYTTNTYLAPIHKGLRLVFDKRDSVVWTGFPTSRAPPLNLRKETVHKATSFL